MDTMDFVPSLFPAMSHATYADCQKEQIDIPCDSEECDAATKETTQESS